MPEPKDLSLTQVFGTGQIRLAQLSVYNWGSFHGLHSADIDPGGTLITGDNGAGKSTLIDGLMALLLSSGKASFNIAAAQGDRTDRTLMSYVRGNYGKTHDGNETATLLKRAGATATGLRALYQAEDGSQITLVEQFRERLNRNATQSLARISQTIEAEREDIQDRIETINGVLERTEFKQGTFLRLGSRPELFEHVKAFNQQLVRVLARAGSDDHEARFAELEALVGLLEKATNPATSGNMESLRLLDSRYQLSFFAEEVDKNSKRIVDVLASSSGKSGGEKESFAGIIVAASLAYVLTPDGSDRPLYCTVFLDEAFSNTAEAVSRRVLKVFSELKIHVNLITPYKNLNLARESARSLLIAERDQGTHESRLCEVTWEEIDQQQAGREQHSVLEAASALGIDVEPDQ